MVRLTRARLLQKILTLCLLAQLWAGPANSQPTTTPPNSRNFVSTSVPVISADLSRWLDSNPDLLQLVIEEEEPHSLFNWSLLSPKPRISTDAEFVQRLTEPDRIRRRTVGLVASAQQTAARQLFAAAERYGLVVGNGTGCESWVGQYGFGRYAKIVMDELRGRDSSSVRFVRAQTRRQIFYDGPTDLVQPAICPAFSKLDDEHKEAIWTAIFMWASFKESSCNPNAINTGAPNGVARGLFQLHDGREAYYDLTDRTDCRNGDSRDPEGSIRCAIGVIEAQFARFGNTLFNDSSYYGVLRPRGDLVTLKNGERKRVVIYRALKEYLSGLPMCQTGVPTRVRHAAN